METPGVINGRRERIRVRARFRRRKRYDRKLRGDDRYLLFINYLYLSNEYYRV